MATVHLVHIGDLHLSSAGARNADRLAALDQIITAHVADEALGAWLFPGDLFHTRSSIDDRNALAERLARMADAAPVCLCYGNHDLPGDLDVFARIRARHRVYVFAEPTTFTFELATGQTAVGFALPYPTRASLIAAGVPTGDVVDTAAAALVDILRYAGHQLAEAQRAGQIAFAIGHINVSGALMSAGQPNIGKEIELNPSHLALLGDVYVGLNHIHRPQTISGAHYAGSVCRLDYGETEEKRVLLVEYTSTRGASSTATWRSLTPTSVGQEAPMGGEARGAAPVDPPRPFWTARVVSCPLAVPPRYHVEGELTRDGFSYRVTNGPDGATTEAPADWAGADVRVRYRFTKSEASLITRDLVKAPFAGARNIDVEPIAVIDRALRSPAVASARSLQEKAQAWAALNGITATEGLLAKLANLEHAEPVRLLNDLSATLARLETDEQPALTTCAS